MIKISEENSAMGDELHECDTVQEAMKVLREATESRGKYVFINNKPVPFSGVTAEMLENANEILLTGKLKEG